MATLRRGDVELYYEVRGTGAPLLLVAGLAADNSYWVPVVDALAAKYRVILLDNRGSGRTTPLDAATGIGTMADDCIALVRHLGLPKVHLAGHSMGGMIVQDCAIRHPDLVDRIVLAATAPVASARDNDLFASWASAVRRDRPVAVVPQPVLLGVLAALLRQREDRRRARAARDRVSVPAVARRAVEPGPGHRGVRSRRSRCRTSARARSCSREPTTCCSRSPPAPRSRRPSRTRRSRRSRARRTRSRSNSRRSSRAASSSSSAETRVRLAFPAPSGNASLTLVS